MIIYDFLVIGSGIAGLSFALKVAQRGRVLLVTKKQNTESSTNYAQGGIAVVLREDDSFEQHIEDTLRVGAGLVHRPALEVMVREGPERIKELMDLGVEFSSYWENGKKVLAFGREGGHSRARIVHKADHTGAEVERVLLHHCLNHPNILIQEHSAAIDLILFPDRDKLRCGGAWVLTTSGELHPILARVTLLATGGCGQVYLHTTNPSIATGDGIAMAWRAGARIANLEFMQFHPTALYPSTLSGEGPAFLISEAVRGFGGVLRTSDGRAFMKDYHPMADLAPRDIVARAIDRELKTRGEEFVYLDITSRAPDEIRERFPNIYRQCLKYNIDITREWIPVVPAAHYMCGGVVTDLEGRTNIPGLYAVGEVAMVGVHGANRLASNSLLEAVVFSHRAAQTAVKELAEGNIPFPCHLPQGHLPEPSASDEEWVLVSADRFQIRKLMGDYVGIVRSTLRLQRAQRRVELIFREVEDLWRRSRATLGLVELRNIAQVALLIIRCALKRKESRGLHFTTDYPYPDETRPPKDTVLMMRRRREFHL
ncbi:MAG: L-aspartate oxidase [bacterium]